MTTRDGTPRLCAHAAPAPVQQARDAYEVARDWLAEDGALAVATVIATWGSAPVPVGGKLVIGRDDRFEGSVSGGCVEAEVIAQAGDVIAWGKPRVLAFGVADDHAWRVGLPCGGRVEVFVERLAGAEGSAFVDRILAARAVRQSLVVTTDLTTGERTIAYGEGGAATACAIDETPAGRVFIERLLPMPQLLLVGGGHIAQVLADLARRIGFSVRLIDPRSGFASPARFPGTPVITEWPQQAMSGIGLDTQTAVVTLAHIADIDDEALIAALASACFYIGALGSRRSHQKRLERLRAKGVDEAALRRLDAPAGLAIGAVGPAEIAVSILAAVVKARRGA